MPETEAATNVSDARESDACLFTFSSAIAAAVEEQESVTRSISANMQDAVRGVTDIDGNIQDIAGATRSIDAATRKVMESSRLLA